MVYREGLTRYRNILGIAVAAVILTAIFVPFQKAEAFTLTTTLPNASGNTTTQSSTGESFEVSITVAAGELLPISSIDAIIDNGQSSVARTTFTVSGTTAARSSGALGIIKDNTMTLTLPSVTANGYGYGYGIVANGISGPTGYSYAFPSSNTFLGGNTIGSSNAVGTASTGFVGPGTITISGKINTGLLSAGSHTLDVLVNTNNGADPDHLVAPQLSFTVNANAALTTTTVTSGTNVSLPPITVPGSSTPITVTISNVQTGGTLVVEQKSASTLDAETPTIFNTVGASTSTFSIGTSTANTAGAVFEIDLSSVTLGSGATIDVTIPYDPTALPSGMSESSVKFFHWTGTAWEDKTLSVNTIANTVTGRLTSLSPVVAGFVPSTTTTPSRGGGGGGGGFGAVDLTPTYPEAYFQTNPLAKVQLRSSGFVDINGQNVLNAKSGQQITISTTFKNYQEGDQDYALIIQITDSNGFTTDLGWTTGKLEGGATTQASRSWTTDESGSYTVKMFVWNGVSQAPTPLSEVTTKNFTVT